MQSNNADYTKNSELITYEEFQIRVADRVTLSASNKDTWWRLVLQQKTRYGIGISDERSIVRNQK
ncbi:MAG: hypothetical protein M3249_02450 [Thermoproteota archaeon]|nr:hypothetical protein [Thermoproteota archaeon]